MKPKVRAWASVKPSELKIINGVCLDIDDTLSTDGKLTSDAYGALWDLKEAGFTVVPMTGRPAGWCDHIARFWPVDAVVGENGAFTFFMERGVRKRLNTPGALPSGEIPARLKALGQKILKQFPHAKWASDQNYRENDLAIDICEDVPRWKDGDVQELLRLCHQAGAHAKLSSIHVNAWYGDYDKCSGFSNWLARFGPAKLQNLEKWIYIGDSPNDEPAFKKFPHSVGVANLKKYLSDLKSPPVWMTRAKSGEGFREMADRLIFVQRSGAKRPRSNAGRKTR